MDDAALKSWLEQQWKLGGLKAFMKRIETRKESMIAAALMKGDSEFEKGQVAELFWVCDLPESIMKETDDTGADT